jgi:hypothetical protein
LGSETTFEMTQILPGQSRVHVNHLLLQDAYPLELSRNLKPGDTSINIKEPVILTIAFTNSSTNKIIYIYSFNAIEMESHYSFTVVTPTGKRLSPFADPFYGGSGGVYRLGPHQTTVYDFNLSKLCSFDEIGTYTIVANRVIDWLGGNETRFTTTSNPLTIKIVPDK